MQMSAEGVSILYNVYGLGNKEETEKSMEGV